jgi:hypothetical protein
MSKIPAVGYGLERTLTRWREINGKMPAKREMFGRYRLAGIFSLAVLSRCFT